MQKEPLATNFPCLFCNHENSITVKLDKKGGIGELSCKVCGQSFQSGINCGFDLGNMLATPARASRYARNGYELTVA